MAKTMVLKAGQVVVANSEKAFTKAERDTERRTLEMMPDVVLFEIIPTEAAEWETWGLGRIPDREERVFRETAARLA